MQITGFEKKGRKIKVQFEDGKNLLLNYEVFMKNGLKLNTNFSEDRFLFIQEENLRYDIKQTAFNLLSRRLHSTSELKTKLRVKYHHSALIDEVLEHLTLNNYLDDMKFAQEFASEKSKTRLWGGRKITAELKKRGINNPMPEILTQPDEENLQENIIKTAAEKKLRSLQHRNIPADKLNQKLIAFLLSKGFEYDEIKRITKELIRGVNDDFD